MSYEVKIISSMEELNELPKEYIDSYDWEIKKYLNLLIIKFNDEIIYSQVDGGEPEDQSFLRDWSWVKSALEEAFRLGKLEGLTEKG